MGPKKGKEVTEDAWRTIIEEAKLDEENWKVKVVLIEAAGSDQDRLYLNKFETFAPQEKRFVIKNICKTETIFMINQLGGEKKVKDDNLRVFEEAQAFLKDKRDIPPEYLALVIKHLIVKMKDENLFIKRQRLEVKEGIRRESLTMVDRAEVRGTVNVIPPAPVEPPPPPPKKGKHEPETPQVPEPDDGKKYNTVLRVRGEEWRDKVYVDDYPLDGPNLYVAVTGFMDALLPAALIKIGIPLTAIVQVRIDASTTRIPSTLLRSTKRGQSQTELLADIALQFWADIQTLRISKDTADNFKNTACIIFSPPYWDNENLSGNPEKVYDELCYLMYDVQDLSRQHQHYLENLEVTNIPIVETENCYKDYYHHIIDSLPLECTNMFSILDSILQSVCNAEFFQMSSSSSTTEPLVSTPASKKPVENKPDGEPDTERAENAENLVKEVFSALCKTEEERKRYRLTYGEEFETHKEPIVLKYGDFAKLNTFHLGNINMDNIVWTSMLNMPLHNLWLIQNRPEGENEAKINFHVNILLSCFERDDVETAELQRLIHILGCRKLYNNRSSLKKQHLAPSTITEFKKVYLKRSILAEPLQKCPSGVPSNVLPSFPSMTRSNDASSLSLDEDETVNRIKFLFDCPDISELVSAEEIANSQPMAHIIDEFDHFEDFYNTCAFQILFDVFNHFNCVDYKYCEVTDCFLLMFFNSHDNDGISREEWRCHIPTPLCLQDFFDYILEECYEWIQKEEDLYNEKMDEKSSSDSKVLRRSFILNSCIEDTEVDADLLMEGSLKYNELSQVGEDREHTETNFSGDKVTSATTTNDSELRSYKKNKTLYSSTPKMNRTSRMNQSDMNSLPEEIPKPFLGYDLGDRRVEVFGKDSTFFSRDGTRISSSYTLIIPINMEYIILNVVPGDRSNSIWVHKALGDDVSQNILDSCESFRITTKDQVLIYIKKNTYQVPLQLMSMVDMEPSKTQTTRNSTQVETIFETKSFHGFSVTWPNGLITESVYNENSNEISHIKQFYLNSNPNFNEDMRCISLNGEVIIFNTSGVIEVLKPDGGYIKITRAYKRVVVPVVADIESIESDKNKKGAKPKDTKKEKPSKAASKSSKVTEEIDEKPLEYELVIEEFETIDTSGLRQKWFNETSFEIEKLLIRTATDYCLGEIFSRRMDGTHVLLNKDGTQIVTFPNKTRIITNYFIEDNEVYPEWTYEEKEYFDLFDTESTGMDPGDGETLKSSMSQKSTYDSAYSFASKKVEEEEHNEKKRTDGYVSVKLIYTIEHANFTTVTVNKATEKISVDSPNKTSVNIDIMTNNYNIILDNLTSVDFDGEQLKMNYEACPKCSSFTTCDIKIKSDELSSVTKEQQHWLKMKDSFCKRVVVNEEGLITLSDDCSEEALVRRDEKDEPRLSEDGDDAVSDKTEASAVTHGRCRAMYLAKTVRFFVMQRDLTCSELVHRAILERYMKDHRWLPWYSMQHCNSFGDHRSLQSILNPLHITETEKWIMESRLADVPKYLTYKDLKKDCGKGFYHWMRPYERFQPKPMKPETVLLPRLPRAYILRTLEQQWKEADREKLKGGKELLRAILKYRHVLESDSETLLHVPIIDVRPEPERTVHEMVQAFAHKLYEDLKARLDNDVELRTKADITTKPPPVLLEEVEAEQSEVFVDVCKSLEEERESQVRAGEAAEGGSANLRRYWRTRAEERKEQDFYLYLLREGSVPPYFRNVLGGAIWWEMNHTADDAVQLAERRKMKCVCAHETGEEMEPFM